MNIISNCINRFPSIMVFLKNKSTFLQIFKKFNFLAPVTTNSTLGYALGVALNLGIHGQEGGEIWKAAPGLTGEVTAVQGALGQT